MRNIEEDIKKYGYIKEHTILQYDTKEFLNKIKANGIRKKIIAQCPSCEIDFGFIDLEDSDYLICPECGFNFSLINNLSYKTVYTDRNHYRCIIKPILNSFE